MPNTPVSPEQSRFAQNQAAYAAPGQVSEIDKIKQEAERLKAENESMKAQLTLTKEQAKREGLQARLMDAYKARAEAHVQAEKAKADDLNQSMGLASPAEAGLEGPVVG